VLPFLANALIAGLSLAIVSAPLGCLVVWRRMAYMGETIAQAGLIGVAVSLMLGVEQTPIVLAATALMALVIVGLGRFTATPLDSLLGLLAHGALAAGVIFTLAVRGGSVDLNGYLFGDIFAVSQRDLAWVLGGGAVALTVLAMLWRSLLSLAVHEDLAMAEGVSRARVETLFMLVLALAIAISIKVVGVLLAIAFLIMPAVAARTFARSPEAMVAGAAAIAVVAVLAGLWLSFAINVPGGPAIVLVLAAIAIAAVLTQGRSTTRR
jgi:zinc transport system permease protein